MKYEVGKAYIHDGSAECPLPKGSDAMAMGSAGVSSARRVEDLHWQKVLAFVPVYIPPQPLEVFVTEYALKSGVTEFGAAYSSEEAAKRASQGWPHACRTIRFREVSE